MKKLLSKLIISSSLTAGFFISQEKSKASASYVPPSQICFYAYSGFNYLCPPAGPNPTNVQGGTPGYNAYNWADQIGVNTHFGESEYQNPSKVISILQYMNIHHVRDGLSAFAQNSTTDPMANTLASSGIHFDMISSYIKSASSINTDINSMNAGVVESLEGPNEINLNDGSWQSDGPTQTSLNKSYVTTYNPGLTLIGTSLGGFESYSGLGNLASQVNYGNTHDYTGGFNPETPGYGGPGYGGYLYGGLDYNLANQVQAYPGIPVAATEFGFQVFANTSNNVDVGIQGAYLLRQVFAHQAKNVKKSYIYALLDSGGEEFGILQDLNTARVAFRDIGGFMNIVKDATPSNAPCTVPASVSTSGVSSFGLCFSDGRYALVLWKPNFTWDTNAHVYNTITTTNTPLIYSPGFAPTSVTQWKYPMYGDWANSGLLATGLTQPTVPVNDLPSIVMFNGPSSPSALPTPPVIPAIPTPGPGAPTPAPTVAPTSTPVATPTPTASPSPTPSPTPGLVCSPPFSAPGAYPDSCFQPYASTSVWNQSSPAPSASVDTNSSTWMSFYTGNGYTFFNDNEFGYSVQTNQYQHPIYFGKSSDPTWTINSGSCPDGYGNCSGSFHAPNYIVPAGGSDHHMTVIDMTNNTEYDFYGVTGVNSTTHVINAGNSDRQNYLTGDGLNGEQTHSGYRLWAGVIRAQELAQGNINHALIIIAPCTSTLEIFPSITGTGTDTECSGNHGAPYGGWFRLNMSDATIAAQTWPTYVKTIAYALAHHGGFIGDTTSASHFSLQFEADPMYSAAGYTNSNCPSNGAPCTPLTAYFNVNYPGLWNGSRYVVNLSAYIDFATYGQFIDNPPGT